MGPREPAEPAMRIERVPMDKDGKPLHHMYDSDALWLTMWNLNILWGLGWPELLDEFSATMVRYADVGGRLFSLQGTSSEEPVYEITAPEFDEITIQLDPRYYSGMEFRIITLDNTPDNVYIQNANLNGRPLDTFWFHHKDFAKGCLPGLWLGPEPNKAWGRR